MSEGVIFVAQDGKITYANPAACRMLASSEAEVVGKPEHAFLHKARADGTPFPADRCPIQGTLRDGSVHHSYGEIFWRRDGSSFPVEYTSAPLRDASGAFGAVVIFTDNSERRVSAEVERKAEGKLQRVFESIPEAFVSLDPDWRLTYVNSKAAKLTQEVMQRALPVGSILWDVLPELRGTIVEEHYQKAMATRAAVTFETSSVDGTRWFELTVHPLDDGLGVYYREITERKKADEESRAASIARPLARKIIQDLVETGGVAHQILTQVGRNLAGESASKTMDDFVVSFAGMGLGQVRVERVEGQRYAFAGSDLLEKRPGSRVTTCSFTLGYLSEAVSRIHNHEPTLGTEIECQSRGAKECKFVVQVKKPEEGLARRVKELV